MKNLLLLLSLAICNLANAQYTLLSDFSGNNAFTGVYPEKDQNLISDGTFLYGIASLGGIYNNGVIFKILPNGTGYVKIFEFADASNGVNPIGSLIFDGTFLYGMTNSGGASGLGTIFKILPNGTGYFKLLDFTGSTNGNSPKGSLFYDGTFLYGMTLFGGINDEGTLFKISPNGTGYLKLLDFVGSTNGRFPIGSLISDGTFLYGMTRQGGSNDLGTLFKIMNDGTGYVKLLDFSGTSNGSSPYGSLISDGTFLYGMTSAGGTFNNGTLFKIMPNGTGHVKLIDFDGITNGSSPYGSLISDGTFLYGMTNSGGTNNLGTLFKIMPNGTSYVKQLDFIGISNGSQPLGSLFSDGTFFFGMTSQGGINNAGTLFKIQPNGTGYVKLFDFSGAINGRDPIGSLISDGTFLYGMTNLGGINNLGTIFKIMPNGTGYTKLLDFEGANNGSYPYGSLISDGTFLYGITNSGGTYNLGTIFKIMPNGTGYVKLFDFDAANGNRPLGSLFYDGTFLYGMTSLGGANNRGTIFKINLNGTGYTTLLDFDGPSNGRYPNGDLISDGTFLYGVTSGGGTNDLGTIFKILPNGTGYAKLFDFAGLTNGSYPTGSLISDGTFLYGVTWNGGANNLGTLFKIMPNGTGYIKLLDFSGTTNGYYPQGSLLSDGTFLYGMTNNGGANDFGTFFKILPNGTGYMKILDFDGSLNGANPLGALISDGTFLYGMTRLGGSANVGSVFKYGMITEVIENNVEIGFEIYPNPSIGIFHFEVNNLQLANSEIEVYNVMGEKVFSRKLQNDKFEIDLSNQSNGIYLVQLRTDPTTNAGGVLTKKIIINK